MAESVRLPGWLRLVNPIMMALSLFGLAPEPIRILSVPGRRSGKRRSTPVSPFTVEGQRYIATAGETQWVKNARAAGWGRLTHGRQTERVALIEVPAEQRPPILREVPRQVPQGVRFYQEALGISGDPDSFAAAAPSCRVFRIVQTPPASKPAAL
jgi:deazaflavin-dependent oxidoreductase (nitroreductase family)